MGDLFRVMDIDYTINLDIFNIKNAMYGSCIFTFYDLYFID